MVRTLRRNAGLTGVELARRVGISQSRISRLETGDLVPQGHEVDRLADALNVDAIIRALIGLPSRRTDALVA